MEENNPDNIAVGSNPEDPAAETVQAKKKRNRSSKKSVVVEDERRQKFIEKLINCERLQSHAIGILKLEEEEKGHLYKMNSDEMEKLWNDLRDPVKTLINDLMSPDVEQKDDIREVLDAIISLLQHTAIAHDVVDSEAFAWIVVALNFALLEKNTGQQLKNKISELCECCCNKGIRVDGGFYLNTINFLLDLTLDDKNSVDRKPEIKRMWEMRVALARLNLRTPSCEGVVTRLEKAVASPAYLSCKEGRQFIAFTFTLDIKLIKRFHQAIKDFLSICKSTQASAYGEVYYSAWINGNTEVRQKLEKYCIQNLITHMMVFQRRKQELVHTGQNVFTILSYLHNHRTTAQFSKVLTELYMPLLWRHLRSGNNIERANAALVFLDAYPLEMPGSGRAEESDFYIKQHNEMVDLLTDSCHIVRIIAIKGICSRLCSAWLTFPQETIQVLMRNLIELSNDASDYKVRVALYDSLRDLLLNPDSATYLLRVLPKLRDHIHDENEKVRKAFIKLLLCIKTQSTTRVNYWKIVPVEHLAARLALEKADNGSLLCKLLMSSIYSPGQSVDVFLYRIIKFIEINPSAARRLFYYSSKVLEYKEAIRIMLTILLNLRAYVKKKLEESNVVEEQEEKKATESSSSGNRKKKKRKSLQLQTISENDQNESDEESTNKENSSQLSNTNSSQDSSKEEDEYAKPEVFPALVDIVSLLWSMHSNKLADPERHKDHEDLLDCAVASIPLFLRYYKGSSTYFAVVVLASFVPPNRLIASSTVCSACAASLKAVSQMTPQAEIDVLINALCSWNRFVDIQDVVVDWLDQAFRCEGLNQSQAPTVECKQRKVRFIAKGGKPMLALRLLDAVFCQPLSKKRVMAKAYNQVYELYTYLERIKILIDRRLLGGLPLDAQMLDDEFLLKCFLRYTKLIVILHRPEPQSAGDSSRSIVEPFDAGDAYQHLVEWATLTIRPMLPQRLENEPDISVLLMKELLYTAANLVDLNYANKDTMLSLAALIKNLLTAECSLWYVESSMIVVKHMKDYCEAFYGPQDKDQMLRTVIPSLLSQAMRSLSENKYTREEVDQCVENLYELKTSMYEVVNCLKKLYGPNSQLVQSVLKLFTDNLVSIISTDIKQLHILDTVDKVQELPFVCGILLSIVSRANIAPLWLATMPSSISHLYAQDADLLAAAVSLLHTLAHSGLSLPKKELGLAVRAAHGAVIGYSRESTATRPSGTVGELTFAQPRESEANDEAKESTAKESLASLARESVARESFNKSKNTESDFNDTSFTTHSIDVKKVAPPVLTELAAFLNCTLE